MATVGELLKATRETYGYTLEEVAVLTRIPLKYIQWLEEDNLGTMPEESYFLGFLSAYASFLGLSSSDLCYRLLGQYKALRKGKITSEKTEGADTPPVTAGRKPSSVRGAQVVDPAQLKIFSTEEAPPAPAAAKEPPIKDAIPAPKDSTSPAEALSARFYGVYFILILFILVALYFAYPHLKDIFIQGGKTPSPPSPAVQAPPSPKPSPLTPAPAKPSPTTPAPVAPAPAKSSASVPASPSPSPPKTESAYHTTPLLPLRLEARATEDTWIGVRIDGASNRQEFVLKKGERTTWWAKERFTVTVGNAGGVELLLNGKSLGPLGKHGEVIPDMLLTKEGRK